MIKAYEYRLYPTKDQEILLNKHFGCSRWVYNWALSLKTEAWKRENKNLSRFDIQKQLPILKKQENTAWLGEVLAQSLQSSLEHLDQAYTRFFREKKGFPKFKSKKTNKHSYSIPQHVSIDFEAELIHIPKFKEKMKIRISRTFEGKIKTCTVKKTPTNKYFISILVDDGKELPVKPTEIKTAIGIDLGLSHFLITSDGTKVDSPKFLRVSEAKLKAAQRKHSKKKLGSKNREKQRIRVARIHEKIANQRKDFHYKTVHKLLNENQVDMICMETLNIKGMLKNHKLAKSIQDASWYKFLEILKFKCEWKGVHFEQIGQFESSSKICSACGWRKKDLNLNIREWTCEECGSIHDRDINAALNIRDIALFNIGSDRPEYTLVETEPLPETACLVNETRTSV